MQRSVRRTGITPLNLQIACQPWTEIHSCCVLKLPLWFAWINRVIEHRHLWHFGRCVSWCKARTHSWFIRFSFHIIWGWKTCGCTTWKRTSFQKVDSRDIRSSKPSRIVIWKGCDLRLHSKLTLLWLPHDLSVPLLQLFLIASNLVLVQPL